MPDDFTQLLKVTDIMEIYGLSRTEATRLLKDPLCPTLPRSKRGTIYVTKAGWLRYLEARSQVEAPDK